MTNTTGASNNAIGYNSFRASTTGSFKLQQKNKKNKLYTGFIA